MWTDVRPCLGILDLLHELVPHVVQHTLPVPVHLGRLAVLLDGLGTGPLTFQYSTQFAAQQEHLGLEG